MPRRATPEDKLRRALALTGVIVLSTIVYIFRLSLFFALVALNIALDIFASLPSIVGGTSGTVSITETPSFPLPERIPRKPPKNTGDTNILIDQDNIATHGGVINAPIAGNVIHPDAHYRRRRTR